MPTEIIYELKNIDKSFGELKVFDQLNLSVQKGETIALVGNSGTGKSILVKMLIGLVAPDSGKILFENNEIQDFNEPEWMPLRQRVSMVFQANALFDSFTVYENLAYPLRQHLDLPEEEISKRVSEVLSWVNLPGTEALFPSEMSGGMKKRAGVARAIILQPEMLLYDEPTAGLDPVSTTVIDEMVKRFQKERGVTSIVITHDLRSAINVADRIALLHNGKVFACLPPQEMLALQDPISLDFFEGYRMMTELLGFE